MNLENEKKTGEFTGKSIEEAKQKAADEFGVKVSLINFRVENDVKKSLFGKIKEEAKVFAEYSSENTSSEDVYVNADEETVEQPSETEPAAATPITEEQIECCRNYLKKVLEKMDIDVELIVNTEDGAINIEIESKGSGAVIGRRGETLDALQYLTSLVVNKFDGDYKRVTLDSCGYRKKREETLTQLAEKIAQKALKTGRSTTLEPMNPYERRIIHSTVSKIEGVNSKSVGEEPYRKVIISSDNPRRNDGRRNGGGYKKRRGDGPRSLDLKTSFEKDYKKPKPEDNINAGLYGKIEI